MAPERTCVACYGTIPDGARFCPHCGAGSPAAPAAQRERGDVERGCLMGFGAFVVLPIVLALVAFVACVAMAGVGAR